MSHMKVIKIAQKDIGFIMHEPHCVKLLLLS